MMEIAKDRGPGVKFPPPLIFVSFLLFAYWLERSYSLPISDGGWLYLLAGILVCLGLSIGVLSAWQFWWAKTHIEPWQPASRLIISGIFAYSRNPIYVAFILVSLAAGLWLNSLWIVFSVLPAILVLYVFVIRKEERYLEKRFGTAYLDYKETVRRWL